MTTTGRAVVVGASVAGLLAARVLAEHYDEVVVLDRDQLPTGYAVRARVPQAQHAHGLLAGGLAALESLLPGLTRRLIDEGALAGDVHQDTRWVVGGRELAHGHRPLATGLLLSRPLLEGVVRELVTQHPSIEVIQGTTVTGLMSALSASGAALPRVTGVRLDGAASLSADVVVLATGRGTSAEDWLAAIGAPRPEVDRVRVDLGYTTREFRRDGRTMGGSVGLVVAATPEHPRGAAVLAQEDGTWVVTLAGYDGDRAPDDLRGFADFAAGLPTPWALKVITECDPVGPARHFRMVESVRRRFERLDAHPEGLLILGDALCSFNPVYGQGMTVAALEAQVLGRELSGDPRTLARRFYRRAARLLDAPWEIAVTSDLAIASVRAPRSRRARLTQAYLCRVAPAACADARVAATLISVLNLLAPPAALFRPHVLAAILTHAWRPSRDPAPGPSRPATTGSRQDRTGADHAHVA